MIKYEFVTLTNGRRFYLRLVSENTRFLNGIRVARDTDEVLGTHGEDQVLEVLEKTAIKRRTPCVVNQTYGELEPVRSKVAVNA